MRIAILLSGHIRTWNYCKQNFKDALIDEENEFTIIVDTYTQLDASKEWYDHTSYINYKPDKSLIRTTEEIESYFSDFPNNCKFIFNIVDEIRENNTREESFVKKYNTYKILDSLNENFDIVVRSRFDLMLNRKVEYNFFNNLFKENTKIIFQSYNNSYNFGRDQNDSFVISTKENIGLVMRKDIDLFTENQLYGKVKAHDTLNMLTEYFGIERVIDTFNTAIVRDKNSYYMIANPQFYNSPFKRETADIIELW